jgi:uncharacterized membrane protein YuzA (DUF378 family)
MREIRDALYKIAIVVTFIGALNWGFIGLFDIDSVKAIFPPSLHYAVYLFIGVMALYAILCIWNIL